MRYVNSITAVAAASALMTLSTSAGAQDFAPQGRGTFVLDLRGTEVAPDSSDQIRTAAGADSGLHVHVRDSAMPTLGFTYFLSDHIAAEAILGATEHDISARGPGTDLKVHSTWVLPPVVTLQYHFAPRARFSPYVGAGVNAMVFFAGANANGYRVRLNDGVGAAVQAGADLAVRGPWALNLDVKKVFVEDKATIDGGALYSNVHLDPLVISAGLGRRF